jgi:16S rRNA (cytosine1402-N4)-methyltransferase
LAPDKTGEAGEPTHLSVLAKEAVELLACSAGGIVVDGTVGGGGHAELILRLIGPTGKLVGMDCDQYAIERVRRRLGSEPGLTLVRENFSNLKETLERLGLEKIDALLLDLGLSSFHLGQAERGFSFAAEAPLDMRMDQRLELTAADIVNDYSESELANILRKFGEEPNARRIARAMARERSKKRIRTTTELADIVRRATPRPSRHTRINPATRTFQALRIEVNSELDNLKKALDDGISALRPGGRVCVISFHSLEDRIVKKTFAGEARACVCPPEFPVCVCDKKATLKILTPRPIKPSADEIEANPRSRSAKLRAAEKTAAAASS